MAILNTGAMINQGLSSLGDTLMRSRQLKNQMQIQDEQRQRQQQQDEAMRGLAELYATNPTTEQLYQYGLQNPAAYQMAGDIIGFKNEQTKNIMQDTLISALRSPENKDAIIQQGANAITAAGGNPENLLMSVGEDFGEFEKGAVPFLASLGGQGANFAKSYMSMKPQGQKPMTAYEQAKIGIDRTNQEIKILELKKKNETDSLKREKLEQEIQAKKDEKSVAESQRVEQANDAYQAGQDTIDLIDRIQSHPGFESYVGAQGASSLFGAFDNPIGGTDAAAVAGMIETLQSKNFMNSIQQMKGLGALSDAEGRKLSSAIESLNPKMSEKDFNRSLNVVKNITKRGMRKQQKILGSNKVSQNVVFESPKYGKVTEADINKTMSETGLTRAQIMARLRG